MDNLDLNTLPGAAASVVSGKPPLPAHGGKRKSLTISGCRKSCSSRHGWRLSRATTPASSPLCPPWRTLANCDDDALHKLWEGLGYYSRVRNLKKAAQVIQERYNGQFPGEYDAVLALPGIGEYTAGAVCSIAFDLPVPAVDGNVLRVFSRLTDDPSPIDLPAVKASVRERLAAIYPKEAGDFTQALMELGATVCGPNRKPECGNCPCRKICLGYQHGTAETLPVKSPKRERRQEDRTVFILQCDEKYALEKRPGKGLLAGLWQFPNVTGHLDTAQALAEVERMGLRPGKFCGRFRESTFSPTSSGI